jgi:intracellular multiplication protein IcmP
MAKGAPEPQQPSGDHSLDFLWLIVLIVVGVMFIWYFGKIYIAMGVFKVRLYEIKLIDYLMGFWASFAQLFNLPYPDLGKLQEWVSYINQNYGAAIEFGELAKLSDAVGKFLRYPAMLILAIIGAMLYLGGTAQKFRNIFDMDKMRLLEKDNWPQIKPIMKVDLFNMPLDKLPWAMSQDPMRFCKTNNLLREEKKGNAVTVTLRRGAAYRLLSLQLGPRWYGIDYLPDHAKALFAIFIARIDGDKKSADELVDHIANSSESGNLDFSGANELLKKHINAKPVVKILSLHGYILTVMASLLASSREAGVLATSEFIWLKPIDRRMWYMLNSVGRPTAFAEIAGAFAHWLAEKKLGLPLMVPMVDEAVKGLEIALSEILYKPEE